jgi:hypothetical protein
MSAPLTHRRADPSSYVSPEEEAREQQKGIALDLDTLAQEIANVTDKIYDRACSGSWSWPAGRAALEQLMQDMATLKARLEHARDMG